MTDLTPGLRFAIEILEREQAKRRRKADEADEHLHDTESPRDAVESAIALLREDAIATTLSLLIEQLRKAIEP